MPGLFHAGAESVPASLPLDPLDPLLPLLPEEPLDPEVPLDPLDPLLPLVPEEPLVPLVPLVPDVPLVPEVPDAPLVPGTGSVGDDDVSVIAKRSDDPAPLHATRRERTLDANTTAAARDFMTAELYRPQARCPMATTHDRDSLTSLSGPTAGA
ncbi:MAG: hypothetical protein JWP87_735 [Labilithrix sp.]|nr:hypothetical protein [Labilithrix sp.]